VHYLETVSKTARGTQPRISESKETIRTANSNNKFVRIRGLSNGLNNGTVVQCVQNSRL